MILNRLLGIRLYSKIHFLELEAREATLISYSRDLSWLGRADYCRGHRFFDSPNEQRHQSAKSMSRNIAELSIEDPR